MWGGILFFVPTSAITYRATVISAAKIRSPSSVRRFGFGPRGHGGRARRRRALREGGVGGRGAVWTTAESVVSGSAVGGGSRWPRTSSERQ